MEKNRLEAFSDGVLAIIITIMILELKVPHTTDWQALSELVPQLLGYILSFTFIGTYWVNHHHMLQIVKRVNSAILWANLNLLFWLSLIPLATGWMSENHFTTNPIIVYAILLLLCGMAFMVLQWTILRSYSYEGELHTAMEHLKYKSYISTAFYIAAIPLALYDPRISCGLFVAVSILWFIPERSIERALNEK